VPSTERFAGRVPSTGRYRRHRFPMLLKRRNRYGIDSGKSSGHGAKPMTFTLSAAMLQPIVALLAGILILLIPRILNFVVAIYLIFVGVTGLWPHLLSGLPH
jgi:Protein of unknown function (DUF3096)